jgi:hypothetical protein
MTTRRELEERVRAAVARFAPYDGLGDILPRKDLVIAATLEAEVKSARAALAEHDAEQQRQQQQAQAAAQRQAARDAERERRRQDRADEAEFAALERQLGKFGPAELQQLERVLDALDE